MKKTHSLNHITFLLAAALHDKWWRVKKTRSLQDKLLHHRAYFPVMIDVDWTRCWLLFSLFSTLNIACSIHHGDCYNVSYTNIIYNFLLAQNTKPFYLHTFYWFSCYKMFYLYMFCYFWLELIAIMVLQLVIKYHYFIIINIGNG